MLALALVLRIATGSPRARREVETRLSCEDAVTAARLAAAHLGWQVTDFFAATEVRATVDPSWRSWGEYVTVRGHSTTEGTRMTIESRPRFPATLVDWGKGKENVDKLLALVGSAPDRE